MGFQEDYTFWKLASFLMNEEKYQLIKLSDNRKEMWLEHTAQKQAGLIRLVRHDLDWSNRMMRDIDWTAEAGESIRKQMVKRELTVVNIYVSVFPPVDGELVLSQPYSKPESPKTTVQTILLTSDDLPKGLEQVNALVGGSFHLQERERTAEEVAELQRMVLSKEMRRKEEEKKLFDYGKPLFTYIFIAIQLIMFAVLEFNGGSTNTETLIKYGAKFNPLILQGEWWRLLTPIFLHIGFLHLLMNTVALYYLGETVERIYGNVRFLFIYLFSGFFGAAASFVITPSLSAGASGAIFGCFGALLYFGVIYPRLFFRTMGMNILVVIGINLLFGFTVPGIDNAGHIGGLIGGFVATGVAHFPKKKRLLTQVIFTAAAAGLSAAVLTIGYSQAALDAPTVTIMAQQYIQEGKDQEAYELLTDFEKTDAEKTAETYFFLSYIELKNGELSKAENHLQQAIAARRDFHEAYFNLALLYHKKGDYKRAIDYVKTALEYAPKTESYERFLQTLTQ